MRRFALMILACAFAGLAARAQAGAEEWKSDAETCSGLYGALEERKASMAQINAAVAKSNLASIDWAARKAGLQAKLQEQIKPKLYQDNFNMMVLKDTIDGTTEGMATVLDLSQRCDAAFGFKPSFAFAPKPAPTPAPPPAPKPAAPAPAPAKVSDLDCAVRYLTLAAGLQANSIDQQGYMGRANAAGGRQAAANPSVTPAVLAGQIEIQAKARGEKILAKQATLQSLITDIRACDAQYGYPLTPYPPQPK